MGIIIILFLIAIIGLIFLNKDVVFEVLLICGTTACIIVSLAAITEPNVDKFNIDYNNIKYETLLYRNANVPDNYNYLSALIRRVDYINKKIESNRKYSNNFWVGCFYDKDIGEYKIIDIEKELKKNN